MTLQFYNSMSRQLETFLPQNPDQVKIYSCGPTVYNYAHIGNFRTFIFNDLLRRYLKYKGYGVNHVLNITDIDDKTITGSQKKNLSLQDFTTKYTNIFFQDCKSLNIEPVEHNPKATDYIPHMVKFIEKLNEQNFTYQSDGSTYFKIAKFPKYGRLSRIDTQGLQSGTRYDADEYDKDDIRDFVLWKSRKENEPFWETPFGAGRPGWHIECSAMSQEILGESLDIHTGGVDLIFPHHENEIAQSEACGNHTFVRYWLHVEHLLVENQKMSKSLGNLYTLNDLIERGYTGREIRYLLISAHYRKKLNFTLDGLISARHALKKIDSLTRRLYEVPVERPLLSTITVQQHLQDFETAMDQDLNISEALAVLFSLIHLANQALEQPVNEGDISVSALISHLKSLDAVFGFIFPTQEENSDNRNETIHNLVQERQKARADKNFKRADEIRDILKQDGIIIEDTPQGTRWYRE